MTFSANCNYVCLYKAQTSSKGNTQNLLFIYLPKSQYLQAGVHTHKRKQVTAGTAEIGTPDKASGLPEDRNKSDCEMQIVSTAVLFLILLSQTKSLPLHLPLPSCIPPCLGQSPPHRWHRLLPLINHVLSPIYNKSGQRSRLCRSVGFKDSLPWKTIQEHSLVAASENSSLAGHHPARRLRASSRPSEGCKRTRNTLSVILHSGTRSFSQLYNYII